MLNRRPVKEIIADLLLSKEPPPISEIIHRLSVEQRLASAGTIRTYVYETINRLSAEGHNISLPKKKTGEVRHEDIDPISEIHRRIGYRLNYYRDITEGKTPGQFCALYDYFSPRILRKMELGAFDFTLTDLTVIADLLGVTIPELIEPTNTGATCPSSTSKHSSTTLTR